MTEEEKKDFIIVDPAGNHWKLLYATKDGASEWECVKSQLIVVGTRVTMSPPKSESDKVLESLIEDRLFAANKWLNK